MVPQKSSGIIWHQIIDWTISHNSHILHKHLRINKIRYLIITIKYYRNVWYLITIISFITFLRNSLQLVEAAFDGDFDELKNWIDKGYHLESFDGWVGITIIFPVFNGVLKHYLYLEIHNYGILRTKRISDILFISSCNCSQIQQ